MVDYKIKSRCRDELEQKLRELYTELPAERCAMLMAEDPQREARRNMLQKKRNNLRKALQWLTDFQTNDAVQKCEDTDEIMSSETTANEGYDQARPYMWQDLFVDSDMMQEE